jgi:hypothetical protein
MTRFWFIDGEAAGETIRRGVEDGHLKKKPSNGPFKRLSWAHGPSQAGPVAKTSLHRAVAFTGLLT